MKLTIRETAIFGMLGAVMYASKIIMEFIPNVHLLGVFTVAFTVVYRKKALYPIYTYVILNGVFSGFTAGWFHIYIFGLSFGALSCFFLKKCQRKYSLSCICQYARHMDFYLGHCTLPRRQSSMD